MASRSQEVNVLKKFADDMQIMVNNKEFSDFEFNVNGKIFFAHKIILSTRSPVFAAMFRSEMKETLNNMAIIDDIDHEVFEEFLTFVYTGKAPKISALADSLLPVADKYGITQLKSICEESFVLSDANTIETLIMAYEHSLYNLKSKAIIYFLNNNNFIRSKFADDWRALIQNYPQLVDEIFGFIDKSPLSPYVKRRDPREEFDEDDWPDIDPPTPDHSDDSDHVDHAWD